MSREVAPSILFVHAGAELYGADRILLELTAGLRERGYAQQVVLPGPGPLHEALGRAGVPTHQRNLGVLRRRYFTLVGLLNRLYRVIGAVRFMRALIRQHDVSIVHSNTTAVFAGALVARLMGLPHVWHVHEITTRPRWFAYAVARCVGLLATRAVFVSAATCEHMCRLNPRLQAKAVVLHNGIDPTRATNGRRGVLRAECGWLEDEVLVGMIGRINWWKGQGKLLECMALLAPQHLTLRCLMVGGTYDGDEAVRGQLRADIERDGLQDWVVMKDFREDVGNVLADLDIFVLPSTEPDPFPTVVLEAMAAGRPIVAFRHGGVCEMVEEGVSGFLCTPGSVSEMAAAIERLANSRALREEMGQAGRQRLDRLFTRDAFITRFAALYAELGAKARRQH